ncbi:MAG TPA: glycosyltransferase family 4 protein, partial [Verrucomicrobiae bacterium]|nr:glycosyltransferase family 4 protein [Verrucomicrobiae bacterium]
VAVLGYVADLAPLYERSVALVAPHLEGTGVRMKLLEAFGHGVPVVTTPAGAAGLPIENGREALVEAEPRAFASAVVSVATDVERARLLRDGAHAFLERHHGLGAAQTAVRVLLGRADAPAAAPAA